MTAKTETPRTDAVAAECYETLIEHAMELERELAQLRSQLADQPLDVQKTDTIATFRKRADNWEANEGEIGKIVASEIRGVVDEFERELTQWREVAGRLAWTIGELKTRMGKPYREEYFDEESFAEAAGAYAACMDAKEAYDALAKLSDGGKG